MAHELSQIPCVDDDGRPVTVINIRPYTEQRTMDGVSRVWGLQWFELEDGTKLNLRDDGERFETVLGKCYYRSR